MKPNIIILFVDQNALPPSWMARHEGPIASEIIDLFGTDTLPTPFAPATPADRVLAAIRGLNPGCDVRLQDYN